MNRSDLVSKLHDLYPKVDIKQIDKVVKIIFTRMSNYIMHGTRIEIRGFGCFSLKERAVRIIRNPRDGTVIESDMDRRCVYFRAGKMLKQRVNNTSPVETMQSDA